VPNKPPAADVSEPAFKALCDNAAGVATLAATSTSLLGNCERASYSLRLDVVGKNWDCDTLNTKWARLLIPYGTPFKAGEYDEEVVEEQREAFEDELVPLLYSLRDEIQEADPDLLVYFWNVDQVGYYLNSDLRYAMLAIVFVYLMLWWQTESLFITSCGLFEIVVSFPLGLFVWNVILQQPYITYLMYSGLFVILGIGADDIFVLVDAFKQSSYQPPHISGSLETRFAWAYNRAASAMLATSFTTAAAFASCAISPIWDISCFGCVAAAMIIADYILVITWLPAALIVNERYLQNCCLWCSPKCITASLGRVFKCCMGSRARSSASAPQQQQQQHPAIDHATALEMTPVKTMAENGSAQATHDNEKNNGEVVDSEENGSAGSVTTATPTSKVRVLEEFYGGAFSSFIIDNAKLLVALFAALFVAATLTTVLVIEPDTDALSFFEDDHVWSKSQAASGDNFGATATEPVTYLTAKLSFGLQRNRPWELNGVHPCDVRTDKIEDTKSFFKPDLDFAEHQEALSNACSAFWTKMKAVRLSDPTLLDQTDGYYCWIDDFSSWLATTKNRAFPVTPTSDFYGLAVEWRDTVTMGTEAFEYGQRTGFLEDGARVYWSFASFNTTFTYKDLSGRAVDFDEMWRGYDDAEKARRYAEKQSGLEIGVQSLPYYASMVSGRAFLNAAVSNLVIGICFAVLVIGVMTMNWKVTVIAVSALVCVVACVFMCMAAALWKINVIESIGISLAAGMAVDYVLHLAHSFNHQRGVTSAEKVRGCLAEMGISITNGCLTSFASCCCLYMCDFLWFKKFGHFITMIIFCSFFVSMVGMSAAFVVFGPGEAPDGVIPVPAWLKRLKFGGHSGHGHGSSEEESKEGDICAKSHVAVTPAMPHNVVG
jgi:hypothetical protein